MFEPASGTDLGVEMPDPEATAKAKRRRFTAHYKQRVLREADA